MNLNEQLDILSGKKLQGRLIFQGLQISVENKKGSVRKGIGPTGKKWSTLMSANYGYVRMSEGTDGDHVDCYIGPNTDAKDAYVVHQNNPETGDYDEDKCLLGYDTPEAAKKAYLAHYDSDKFFGSMTTMSMAKFKKKVLQRTGEKLAAGGEGSGCHGDNCGRPAGHDGPHAKVTEVKVKTGTKFIDGKLKDLVSTLELHETSTGTIKVGQKTLPKVQIEVYRKGNPIGTVSNSQSRVTTGDSSQKYADTANEVEKWKATSKVDSHTAYFDSRDKALVYLREREKTTKVSASIMSTPPDAEFQVVYNPGKKGKSRLPQVNNEKLLRRNRDQAMKRWGRPVKVNTTQVAAPQGSATPIGTQGVQSLVYGGGPGSGRHKGGGSQKDYDKDFEKQGFKLTSQTKLINTKPYHDPDVKIYERKSTGHKVEFNTKTGDYEIIHKGKVVDQGKHKI